VSTIGPNILFGNQTGLVSGHNKVLLNVVADRLVSPPPVNKEDGCELRERDADSGDSLVADDVYVRVCLEVFTWQAPLQRDLRTTPPAGLLLARSRGFEIHDFSMKFRIPVL